MRPPKAPKAPKEEVPEIPEGKFTLTHCKSGVGVELDLSDMQTIDSALCHHRDVVLEAMKPHTDNPAAVQRLRETQKKLELAFAMVGIYGSDHPKAPKPPATTPALAGPT